MLLDGRAMCPAVGVQPPAATKPDVSRLTIRPPENVNGAPSMPDHAALHVGLVRTFENRNANALQAPTPSFRASATTTGRQAPWLAGRWIHGVTRFRSNQAAHHSGLYRDSRTATRYRRPTARPSRTTTCCG